MASEWGSGPGKAGLPWQSEGADRTPMGHEPKAVTSCGQSSILFVPQSLS